MKLESNDYVILNSYTLNCASSNLNYRNKGQNMAKHLHPHQQIPIIMFIYQINKPTITLIGKQCLTLLFYQHSRENNFL